MSTTTLYRTDTNWNPFPHLCARWSTNTWRQRTCKISKRTPFRHFIEYLKGREQQSHRKRQLGTSPCLQREENATKTRAPVCRTDERTPATKQGGSRDTPRAVPGQPAVHEQAAREGGREIVVASGGDGEWRRAYRIWRNDGEVPIASSA